jgi:DNA-binding NtrC family response regulator
MSKLPILIVDDNRDACNMLSRLLSAFGYDSDIAYDGRTALELVGEKDYGIAIIDYQMPGLNGVELYREMRAMRPHLAGVFLTGYTTIDVVYPAIEAGVLRVLSKPVDFQELVPILEEHLSSAV